MKSMISLKEIISQTDLYLVQKIYIFEDKMTKCQSV